LFNSISRHPYQGDNLGLPKEGRAGGGWAIVLVVAILIN
jgi:hypothetical protein